MDLISIKEEVAINKQRAVQFPYTGEVVDFLIASIDGLSKDRDEWKDSCCDANKRFQIAEADRDAWKDKFEQLDRDLKSELRDPNGTIWECAERLQKEVDRLQAQLETAENNWSIRGGNANDLQAENKALNTEKVGMIASLSALGRENERLSEVVEMYVTVITKVSQIEVENGPLSDKLALDIKGIVSEALEGGE